MHRSHRIPLARFRPIALALSTFREAASNVPTYPIAEESHDVLQSHFPRSGRSASPHLMQICEPVFASASTTLSPYRHGQNAARRGKHIQACPFETGTVEWRRWRKGFHTAYRSMT